MFMKIDQTFIKPIKNPFGIKVLDGYMSDWLTVRLF